MKYIIIIISLLSLASCWEQSDLKKKTSDWGNSLVYSQVEAKSKSLEYANKLKETKDYVYSQTNSFKETKELEYSLIDSDSECIDTRYNQFMPNPKCKADSYKKTKGTKWMACGYLRNLTSAGAGIATALAAKVGATALVPTLMKTTGTVIAGVGTTHSAITAAVQSFGATALGPYGIVGTAAIGYLANQAYVCYEVEDK